MVSESVLDWLLEEGQPSIRYLTLTQLLHRPPSDPEVRAARAQIFRVGWGAELLADRTAGGWWGDRTSFYRPKYQSTHWKMLVLSDLGFSRDIPAVAKSCEVWMRHFAMEGGGVGGNSKGKGHLCVVGNMARALIRLGYGDDPRVRHSLEWLVREASPLGGWSCFGGHGRNLDSWEGLSAFAAYPRAKWSPAMQAVTEQGAEFFLERGLHRQGTRYPPWYRFHYPIHYYYDVLVGLDILTELGYGEDPRLAYGLRLLRKKRRRDGRWNLDAVHPDVGGAMQRFFRDHPKDRPIPLVLEEPGRPSKLITLRALTVLERVGS